MNEKTQKPLSKRQQEIFDFIRDELHERGYSPTVREICRHVGVASPTSVHRHLGTLEARGYITRDALKSRSIQLTERPKGLLLAGVIAAGSPIEAVEQDDRLDLNAMYSEEDHFLLQVRGDSMIEDHIEDGDLVVVHKRKTCQDGDVVVALVDGDSATLKRFYRAKDKIRLQPANRRMRPIYAKDVQILGKVVGVIRRVA